MSVEKKSPTTTEKLQKAADKTDNPQMKKAIEERLKTLEKDKTVRK